MVVLARDDVVAVLGFEAFDHVVVHVFLLHVVAELCRRGKGELHGLPGWDGESIASAPFSNIFRRLRNPSIWFREGARLGRVGDDVV